MRAIADKNEYKVPATIDDDTILDEIETSLGKDRIRQKGMMQTAWT